MAQSKWGRTIVFLAVVLLVETYYALYNPAYNNPDERSHLQCAVFYQDEGRLPDPYAEAEKIQQDKHPPYTYVLSAAVLHVTQDWFRGSETELRLPGPYERDWQLGNVQKVTLNEQSSRVADGQLLLLRFVMLAHWILAAFFLLRTADLVLGDRPRYSFAIALACALIPQAAMSGAAVTPDTPLSAFSAAAFYFLCVGALGRGTSRGMGLWTGWFLGLALLAKAGAIFLLPVLLVAAVSRALAMRNRGEAIRFVAWTLLLPTAMAGWWYVRNVALYGDPFQMHAQVEAYTHSVRREPLTSTFFEVLVWDVFRTFFGFYQRALLLPRPVFFVLAAICGVAGMGLLLLMRRPVREEATKEALRTLPLAIVGFGVIYTLTLIGNMTVPSAQGRYLYPALGGVVVMFGTGLRVAARLRGDSRQAYFWCAAWLLFGMWGLQWSVLRHESVHRGRAGGEGGVLFYEDCGTAGLQPHKHPLLGIDAPDQGQLGRVVPWRTLNGHPVAIVYEFPITPADRDLQVRVTYFNPDTSTPYVAFEKGHFVYATQRLLANAVPLHEAIELTSTPRELVYPIPNDCLESDKLTLRFERLAGAAAVVSEIWIEKRWLAFDAERRIVRNRTARTLPFELLHRAADEIRVVASGEVAANGEFRVEGAKEKPGGAYQLTLGRLSPWEWREAEAHPGRGQRWLGDMRASGGYRMHGDGVLAVLPFAHKPQGPYRLLVRRRRDRDAWEDVVLEDPNWTESDLEYRVSAPAESLDFVRLIGGWRR